MCECVGGEGRGVCVCEWGGLHNYVEGGRRRRCVCVCVVCDDVHVRVIGFIVWLTKTVTFKDGGRKRVYIAGRLLSLKRTTLTLSPPPLSLPPSLSVGGSVS